MPKRSGMIVGGLLAGLGKGLEMHAAQVREDALLKLRERMVIDAEARDEQRTIAGETRRGCTSVCPAKNSGSSWRWKTTAAGLARGSVAAGVSAFWQPAMAISNSRDRPSIRAELST